MLKTILILTFTVAATMALAHPVLELGARTFPQGGVPEDAMRALLALASLSMLALPRKKSI